MGKWEELDTNMLGENHYYALYFEDPDKIKVEVVAPEI